MASIICCTADYTVDGRDDTESNAEGCSTVDHDGKILECDYDSTCTKLYKLIEGKKWEEIIYFLETGKWYFDTTVFTSMFFGAGPDPRFIESRTWVTALDEMGSVRWCQLPLHAAITFQAPFEVITKLVEVYPESIRCADDQDMLPLHYAFRFGSEDNVLAYLLEEFPQALKKKALRDRSPLDMAHYSSKPERGVIIECFVETSIAEAKAEWDNDHKHALSSKKTKANSSLTEEVETKREKLRNTEYELLETKKKMQQLEEELLDARDARTGPPTTRYSIPSNAEAQRPLKELSDEQYSDPTEDTIVDRKQKGFGKMFGRQKKQSIS